MERFSRDTISLTTAELNELKANKALDPTVEYWVDKNRIVNASGPDTLVEGTGASGFILSGVSGLNQIVTAIMALGWIYDSVQWKRNTSGTVVAATGPGSTTLAYTQVAADVVPGVKIYPDFVNLRYISAGLTAPVSVPGAPTIGTATAGDGTATFAFTAPASDGGSAITEYEVLASNGIRKTVTGAPASITIDTINGVAVTGAVRAKNGLDYGPFSAQSNSVTPAVAAAGPTILSAVVSDSNANNILVTYDRAMDTGYGPSGTTSWLVDDNSIVASSWTTSTTCVITMSKPFMYGQPATTLRFAQPKHIGKMRDTNGVIMPTQTKLVTNSLTAPATVAATATNTLRLAGSYLTLLDTPQWDIPTGDHSLLWVRQATSAGTTGINKSLISTGTIGGVSSVNVYMQPGASGVSPGSMTISLRGDTGTAVTITAPNPTVDGVWYVEALVITGGRAYFKRCPIMGPVIEEGDVGFNVVTSCLLDPRIGMVQAETAQRNFLGSIQRFYKGAFALTNAEIEAVAAGTVPSALAGRTWLIGLDLLATAATYTDNTGNGNTATRFSTSQATDVGPTFGSTLKLYQHAGDLQVFDTDRDGVTTKTVKFSGYWNGTVSDVIRAEVLDYNSGATVSAVADASVSSSGYFQVSVSLPRYSNWCTLVVRSKTYPQIRQRTLLRWGMGEIVGDTGQSQAAGMANYTAGQPTASSLTSRYSFDSQQFGQPNGMGIRTFLNALQPVLNCPVGFIVAAQGGTGLTSQGDEGQGYWDDRTEGQLFDRFVRHSFKWGSTCSSIYWQQGGSDARQVTAQAPYVAALTRLYDDLRTAFGRTPAQMPFFITDLCRIEVSTLNLTSLSSSYFGIRSGQQNWAANTMGAFYVGTTADLPVPNDEGFHWNETGHARHAMRLFMAYKQFLAVVTGSVVEPAPGPKIIAASRNGQNIDLTVVHGTNSTATGLVTRGGSANVFEVALNSGSFTAPLTISSTSFPDANTIRLTLSADPGAPVKVRMGYGCNPGGASYPTDLTRFVYDNRTTMFGDTVGAPVIPTVADLVTA